MTAYGLLVWVAAGLLSHNLWPQLVCYALSVYMMVEMNNSFTLLRVRSRMVSAVFIALSCAMGFLFASPAGAVVQLFFIASLLLLLGTYQSPQSLGGIFYSFLFLSLASLLSVHTLLFAPLLWLLMSLHLQSLSWRGWLASLIGMLTPYWFVSVWFIYGRDFTPLARHFCSLADFVPPARAYATLDTRHILALALLAVLTLTGAVHFWRQSIDEKIRTRLLYALFTWLSAFCIVSVVLQPQHYDPLMRLAVVCASPLVAHFLTLTSSRASDIAFFCIAALTLAVTVANLLPPL